MTVIRPLLLAALLSTTGCFLPLPHFRSSCPAIDGNVIDAKSKRPIEGAAVRIYYADNSANTATTDATGRFSFKSKQHFYWGMIVSPALSYPIPVDLDKCGFGSITIEAPTYEPVWILSDTRYLRVRPDLLPPDSSKYRRIDPKQKDVPDALNISPNLSYPRIALRRQPTSSAPGLASNHAPCVEYADQIIRRDHN